MKQSCKVTSYFILLICVFTSYGCRKAKTFSDLDEFEKYVNGDSYPCLKTITRNGIKMSLRYMPTDAMMTSSFRQYIKTQEKLISAQFKKEQYTIKVNDEKKEMLKQKTMYAQSIYFYLTISYESPSKDIVFQKMRDGHESYSQWLQKLMFALQECIYLQTETIDEIPLSMYHMERTYGMKKSRTFLLLFPTQFNGQEILSTENKWVKLRVNEFSLGTGPLIFEFKLPFEKIQYLISL